MWHEVKWTFVRVSRSICLAPTVLLCFCRWQLAQRLEWGGEHKPCLVLAASERAGSLPSGVWTQPQRRRPKPTPQSVRSVLSSNIKRLFWSYEALTQLITFFCPFHKWFFLNSAWGETTRVAFLPLQVFADGEEPEKRPTDSIFIDPVKENPVRMNILSPFSEK